MARHGGFSIAGALRATELSGYLGSAVKNIEPLFFPLPQSITVAGNTFDFGGFLRLFPPTVVLQQNDEGRVAVAFRFEGIIAARRRASGGASVRYEVRVEASCSAIVTIVSEHAYPGPDFLVLKIDLSSAVLAPLSVTPLSGNSIPTLILAALQSQKLANAINSWIQQQNIFSVPLYPSEFKHEQPRFKAQKVTISNSGTTATVAHTKHGLTNHDRIVIEGASHAQNNGVFPITVTGENEYTYTLASAPGSSPTGNITAAPVWFTIRLKIYRVSLRVLDDALAFGCDFEDYTYGDATQLIDFTRSKPPGWRYYVPPRDRYSDPSAIPILVGGGAPATSDLAILFNLYALQRIIANQVSRWVANTEIEKDVVLTSVSIGYGQFEKELRGREDGLRILIRAIYKTEIDVNVDASVDIYLQPFNWHTTNSWALFVGRVDLNIPWWADILLVMSQICHALTGPILFPFAFHRGWGDIHSKANPLNVANQITMSLQPNGFVGLDLEARCISISAETIDVLDPSFSSNKPREQNGPRIVAPDEWPVYFLDPISASVELLGTWRRLDPNLLTVIWQVRRGDSGALISTTTSPFAPATGGNGIKIPHHSEDLYRVNEFRVRCVLSMRGGNQAGAIWSGEHTIRIRDYTDRNHSFVQWGPHWVHFKNQGTGDEWWHKFRRSRIHRTAVAARCWGLQIAEIGTQEFEYLDDLPFAWSNLNQHRKVLCEYCFFDGPEKTEPLPREDWFVPLSFKKQAVIPLRVIDNK